MVFNMSTSAHDCNFIVYNNNNSCVGVTSITYKLTVQTLLNENLQSNQFQVLFLLHQYANIKAACLLFALQSNRKFLDYRYLKS